MTDDDMMQLFEESYTRAPFDSRPGGLDDGPYLPGQAPRKKPVVDATEFSAVRKRAWDTRRAKYGQVGHR